MKIIESSEAQFIDDFFPLIVELWYNRFDWQNPQHEQHIKRRIHAKYENFSTVLCAYTDNGEPIGFYWYEHDPGLEGGSHCNKYAHIIQCGLFHKYRRQGIGTVLLNEVCDRVKKNGGEVLYTDTYAGSKTALSFYIKSGFIPVAMHPGKHGFDDLGQVYLYKQLIEK